MHRGSGKGTILMPREGKGVDYLTVEMHEEVLCDRV